jgi:hypothetical protein
MGAGAGGSAVGSTVGVGAGMVGNNVSAGVTVWRTSGAFSRSGAGACARARGISNNGVQKLRMMEKVTMR